MIPLIYAKIASIHRYNDVISYSAFDFNDHVFTQHEERLLGQEKTAAIMVDFRDIVSLKVVADTHPVAKDQHEQLQFCVVLCAKPGDAVMLGAQKAKTGEEEIKELILKRHVTEATGEEWRVQLGKWLAERGGLELLSQV